MLYQEEVQYSDQLGSPSEIALLEDVDYQPTELECIDFTEATLTEESIEHPEDILEKIRSESVTWLNVNGLGTPELLKSIRDTFEIHPLVMEDIIRPFQRPKLEEYGDQIFIILRVVHPHRPQETEQVGMVLTPDYLITFQEYSGDEFEPVRNRIRKQGSRLRNSGPDYLMYALLDAAVDSYFPTLEGIGDRLEELEERILTDDDTESLDEIHENKRQLLTLRRSAWSQREMLGQIQRVDSDVLSEETRFYLRDVYDHGIRILDIVESYREMVNNLMDLHMTTLSNRMNEIMKVLTIMATIFIPLTFIAGVYGMNFQYMPELEIWWAYPAVIAFMVIMAGGMLGYFKKKGWF